ncbi:MAG: App1 family protein [Arenimonas sp.]
MSRSPSDAKPAAPADVHVAVTPPPPGWRDRARSLLENGSIELDEAVDAAHQRVSRRLGWGRAQHIAAFRSLCDATGCTLQGRVLASAPVGGPKETDDWWDNLLSTYRRLESDEVPGVTLKCEFLGRTVEVVTDHEGYYNARIDVAPREWPDLWADAMVAMTDGTLATLQPVLTVPASARIGVISDIDDTILESSILHWRTAAQPTFLHNARTRKPLAGVAALYHALQRGAVGDQQNPVFYVSSSPWNLVDLLEDFLDLNAIPPGPLLLQDLGLDEGKFISPRGHRHKLERTLELIATYPQLKFILCGDTGQADPQLYAEAVLKHPDRIAAVYIRDVDPDLDSSFDTLADERLAAAKATGVPMLRVRDSLAIAEHARGLGLIAEEDIDRVDREVERDRARPSQTEAAVAGAIEGDTGHVGKSSETPAQRRPAS